jgi:hypothetical protein
MKGADKQIQSLPYISPISPSFLKNLGLRKKTCVIGISEQIGTSAQQYMVRRQGTSLGTSTRLFLWRMTLSMKDNKAL